jgi:hypothetical protein
MRPFLTAAFLVLGATPALAHEVVPFVEDDFPGAIASAKAKQKPIFVDAWAPW